MSQTDAATAGTSSAVTVLVEDFKAAGAQYLKIIKPYNRADGQQRGDQRVQLKQRSIQIQVDSP